MDERDVVRVMRMVAGGMAAIVALIAGQAQAADADAASVKVVADGTCGSADSSFETLERLADDLEGATATADGRPRGCVPVSDARRPRVEAEELGSLKDAYHAWIVHECETRICLNNLWGNVVDSWDYEFAGANVTAGCGQWVEKGARALAAEKPRYWTIRQVEYGRDPKWGRFDRYHWAIELENTRTGEIVTVDGYRAAAAARSWGAWSPASSDPKSIQRADETGPASDETDKWGAASQKEGCDNPAGTLCDPARCGK